MTNIAAIDCGTNSIKILIAHVDRYGEITEIFSRVAPVRIGEKIAQTGIIQAETFSRIIPVFEQYMEYISKYGVRNLLIVATEALREAVNKDIFLAIVRKIFKTEIAIISGTAEAELAFQGAISDVSKLDRDKYFVIDIGGGSTEIVVGDVANILAAASTKVGCVRFYEKYFQNKKVSTKNIEECEKEIYQILIPALTKISLENIHTMIGVSGTFTALAATHLGLDKYDKTKIHGTEIALDDLLDITKWYSQQILQGPLKISFLEPRRAELVGVGSIIVSQILLALKNSPDFKPKTCVISEKGILHGMIFSLAQSLGLAC